MHRRSLLGGIAALALTVALPLHAQAPPQPEKRKVTIGVGGRALVQYLPLAIAEARGYFKAEGLEVEVLDFPAGSRALQALISGSVDAVSGPYEHTITQQTRGQYVEALVLQDRYAGMVLVLPKDKAREYKSPRDLKGRKIGVTSPHSPTHTFVNTLLGKEGVAPDAVTVVASGNPANAIAMVNRGELDAIANVDPFISQLEVNGEFVAVADTRSAKGMQEVYGNAYAAGCIYVAAEFTRKNPNTSQAIVNAMVRALRFIQNSTPDQIVAAVPVEYYGGDKSIYTAALRKNLESFKHDGSISLAAQRNVERDVVTFDPAIKAGTRIELGKTVNMTFQQKAAQRYR